MGENHKLVLVSIQGIQASHSIRSYFLGSQHHHTKTKFAMTDLKRLSYLIPTPKACVNYFLSCALQMCNRKTSVFLLLIANLLLVEYFLPVLKLRLLVEVDMMSLFLSVRGEEPGTIMDWDMMLLLGLVAAIMSPVMD